MPTKGVLTTHPFGKSTFDPLKRQRFDFVDYTNDDGPDFSLHPGVDLGPILFCFNTTPSTVVGDITPEIGPSDFLCPSHGLANNAQVRLDSDGVLPIGLFFGVYYFVVNATTDTFQLSLTIGGSAITFTDLGVGNHIVVKRGIPFDFTGWSVWAWVKANPNDLDTNKLYDLSPTIVTPATLGTIQIASAGSDNKTLVSASAFWDMIGADPDGNRAPLMPTGQFDIVQIVTHPAFS